MKRFTNSITFDIDYLINENPERAKKNNRKERSFSNEAVFDIENLISK